MEALFILIILMLAIVALPIYAVVKISRKRKFEKSIKNGKLYTINITLNEE